MLYVFLDCPPMQTEAFKILRSAQAGRAVALRITAGVCAYALLSKTEYFSCFVRCGHFPAAFLCDIGYPGDKLCIGLCNYTL